MFLDTITRRNRQLIENSIILHQEGKIPSNSYVIDVDTVAKNAKIMVSEGKKHNLKVFAMTKQIGRNPIILDTLKKVGIDSCVAVDMNDARPINARGLKIGHLGHLVQVPKHETEAGLSFHPEYWTVFSYEKAKDISKAIKDERKQNILARIFQEGDTFYRGHEGGFEASKVIEVKDRINGLRGLNFAGITTFPAQLFNLEKMDVVPTHNLKTLERTANLLKNSGMSELEINAPGTTSSFIFERLASAGVTQVEPGHGLTGTVPLNAFKDLEETPAIIYLSEVSHFYSGKPYCFGGGMYIDPVIKNYDVKSYVGSTPEKALQQKISCEIPQPSAIDYYGILNPEVGQEVKEGDTVVFGFRVQAFVTRAYIVPVSGLSCGNPKVEGVYLSNGTEVGWPSW